MAERRCNQLPPLSSGERPALSPKQTFQGKKQGNDFLPPDINTKPIGKPPSAGMSLKNQNIPLQPNLPLGGRITHFYNNWAKVTQDPWVLETVKGHKIEFTQTPHMSFIPKMHTTLEESALIDLEVQALHQNNCRTNQFVSPLFTVPKRAGDTGQLSI